MIQTASLGRRLAPVAALSAMVLLSACGYFGGPSQYLGQRPAQQPPAAAPAPQQQVQLSPKDRLVRAIENSGCLMTSANVEPILAQSNLTRTEVAQLTQQLAAEGRAEVAATGTIRILSNACI